MADDLVIDAHVTIPGRDLSWTAARATGAGGQNVNKVSSKVDLRFDLRRCTALGGAVKARLRSMAGARLDGDGRLIVVSQHTRDQSRNLDDARRRLVELIRKALVVPKRRRKTKPSRRARARRLQDKRAHSDKKKSRRAVVRDD